MAHRVTPAGTRCQSNNSLHQRWGIGKQWKEKKNIYIYAFHWLFSLCLFRVFPSLALTEKDRISFLGCETRMLINAEQQGLFSKPLSFLCLKVMRTWCCFVYQLLDSQAYSSCQECGDWGEKKMERRLKHRMRIIRIACVNEIACWELGSITEQCNVQTDWAKIFPGWSRFSIHSQQKQFKAPLFSPRLPQPKDAVALHL